MTRRLLSSLFLPLLLGGVSTCAGRPPLPKAIPSPLEREVVAELNRMRRDPPRWARETLAPQRRHYSGRLLSPPGETPIRTMEGVAALDEAMEELSRLGPLPELAWSSGLALAAGDHLRDQGRTGGVGHDGSDGSKPADRMSRHGRWVGAAAESIEYGSGSAPRIVASLIVDDGVADRGHRHTLLSRHYRRVGVAHGPHPGFREMTVLDLAEGYDEGRSGRR
jgi:uncharacterized protein YkwD